MLTMDELKKYNFTKKSFVKSENLIERIGIKDKKVTNAFAYIQAYQACIYNKFHCNVELKAGQKL